MMRVRILQALWQAGRGRLGRYITYPDHVVHTRSMYRGESLRCSQTRRSNVAALVSRQRISNACHDKRASAYHVGDNCSDTLELLCATHLATVRYPRARTACRECDRIAATFARRNSRCRDVLSDTRRHGWARTCWIWDADTGSIRPRSVMIALMYSAGVTSKAGL